MQINPDISEAHQLKGWWESTGCNQSNITSLSNTGMGGGNAFRKQMFISIYVPITAFVFVAQFYIPA